jgi:hypothetical protein
MDVKTITKKDWMDAIADSPIQNLKSIPWACTKLFLVTLLASAFGLIVVYYTESLFVWCCCFISVVCFDSMLFLTLFGVESKSVPPKPMTPEEQIAYERKLGELKAIKDFNELVNNRVPRRL